MGHNLPDYTKKIIRLIVAW